MVKVRVRVRASLRIWVGNFSDSALNSTRPISAPKSEMN